MAAAASSGLTCPNCGSPVPVPPGARIVTCAACGQSSLVQGDRGVWRWQMMNKLDRAQGLEAVKGFFRGIYKARDLDTAAEIQELMLVYLPYWRVKAFVAGWMFGRQRRDKDSTKPAEVEVLEEMVWSDAATDVAELGVHRVSPAEAALQPYDAERLHAEGLVFEPVESPTEAFEEAKVHFLYRGRSKGHLASTFFERFHFLRPQTALVYYPLWVARYAYRQRHYQVVVDGVSGKLLYGKAPGNGLYRAASLVAGMAAGTFLLVNGTALAAQFAGSSDDSAAVILVPIAVGVGLIAAGYRRFRYGEEVEHVEKQARKAAAADESPFGGSWRDMAGKAWEMFGPGSRPDPWA
jgi:hypothetical protein